ncbi:site-specific DNA-methyltransferase [Corynebacterium casei]|uniref:site-specific DNA-methyltransferase n=1 Tax=Corynebacterium casei TaxID=160386 RepID=UPI003FD62186
MSRLSDLIDQLKRENPRLGADLQAELSSHNQRTFGLVFERHLPESVELPGRPVRRGDSVHVLPPRGSKDTPDTRLWRVDSLRKNNELGRVARLIELHTKQDTDPELRDNVPADDLVVVAQHNDTIYPGLRQTGEVIGTDDPTAPFHSVINAENYHALKMLTYTHYHSIDCIYIDPPYNTGAKDWKYNNDYVDGDDGYRHSKWLSFMERRLLIAKQLLNPDDSVLIVTIDEKEYLRLGLLLEQTLPEATIQMVSSVINPTGAIRQNELTRTNEYIYIVMFGHALIEPDVHEVDTAEKVRWNSLRRFEMSSVRGGPQPGPDQFYAVFVRDSDRRIVGTSTPLALGVPRETVTAPQGCTAVFPLKPDGTEMTWGLTANTLMKRVSQGFAKVSGTKKKGYTPYYLTSGKLADIESGEIQIVGQNPDGSVEVARTTGIKTTMPTTHWERESHNAQSHGTKLNSRFLPARKFPFPKSLYAVEDVLRMFVLSKPDATVLDFFSGSGTTAHAVMRLNKQDGGRRRSISVTNNEVSAEEQVKLRKEGLRPGDPEWEQWGICDYVTKPRVEAAITGRTPAGDPIKGDYKFTDEFPMSDGFEANARFFTLTYQPPTRVRYGYAFAEISPLLWLRAGQTGRIIESIPECGWDIAESYAIIENVAASAAFSKELSKHNGIKVIYIVTNDDLVFESMARELADHDAELVRLYSTYLNNFAFQQSRETV